MRDSDDSTQPLDARDQGRAAGFVRVQAIP